MCKYSDMDLQTMVAIDISYGYRDDRVINTKYST